MPQDVRRLFNISCCDRRLLPRAASEAGAGEHVHGRHLPGRLLPGPKDIPDTVAQAGAAAAEALALIDAGYVEMEPNTAYVVEEACSGCKTCITLCPYSAISFLADKKKARSTRCSARAAGPAWPAVRPAPSDRIYSRMRRSSRKSRGCWTMPEKIDPPRNSNPKIVAFFCNWCTYHGGGSGRESRA